MGYHLNTGSAENSMTHVVSPASAIRVSFLCHKARASISGVGGYAKHYKHKPTSNLVKSGVISQTQNLGVISTNLENANKYIKRF